jgi:mono/diheme cytochrome c family protein
MRPAIKSMTDEQLRQILLEGKGKMPRMKKFDEEKVRNLTLFLRDLAAGNPDTGVAATEAQRQLLPHVDSAFRGKCSACHAQDGTGRSSIGKSLKIPDLTSEIVQSQSDKQLAEVISKGKGKMPGYAKSFNSVQVNQFVSHIRAFAKSAGAKEPVENAKPCVPIPQPPPSVRTEVTALLESASSVPNSASSTAPKKPAEVERRKPAETKPSNVLAATTKPGSVRQTYIAKCSACHSSDGSGGGTIGRSMRIPSLLSPQVQGQSDEILAGAISNGVGKMPAYKRKYSAEQIRLLVAYIRELGTRH